MIKLAAIWGSILLLITRVKAIISWGTDKWVKISPLVTPMIQEYEKLSLDGTINKEDRKKLALKALALAEEKGLIKLNPFTRWAAGMIIDRIAQKLPDFKVAQSLNADIKSIIAETLKGVVK